MRSWRIRGFGSSPAVPDDPAAVPDQRARPQLPVEAEPNRTENGRHAAEGPAQRRTSEPSVGRHSSEPAASIARHPSGVSKSIGRRSAEVSAAARRSPPGSPFADAVRGVPPCPLRVRSALNCGDLDRVLSQVREIAVWIGNDGRVRDTGRFLLMDSERVWHSVAFGDAQGSELIARMRAIPDFDTNVLLDAVSSRSGQVEPLWPPRAVAATRR